MRLPSCSIFTLILSTAMPAAASDLADAVSNTAPWRTLEANSEQRQPVYLGLTPLEMTQDKAPAKKALLPSFARETGNRQAAQILEALGRQSAEFEFWPAMSDAGEITFAFARWREKGGAWNWLDGLSFPDEPSPAPLTPTVYLASAPADRAAVFSDFLKLGIYDKPYFGQCIWTDAAGKILKSWLPTRTREASESPFADENRICRALYQPSFFNGNPAIFTAEANTMGLRWPEIFKWVPDEGEIDANKDLAVRFDDWPEALSAQYRHDVRAAAGEEDLVFPKSQRRLRLARKNSAQKDHQLEEFVDWLEERYSALGLALWRQRFTWRGIAQSNLIAIIEGSLEGAANKPVILADHIDTAFAEDVYAKDQARVSVPGADDNATGTAALLLAAQVLAQTKPRHDIWLVHLTGEEFPGDDLGARKLLQELVRQGRDLGAVLIVDMIGYRDAHDPVFQLSAGRGEASRRLAAVAAGISDKLRLPARNDVAALEAKTRARWDPQSYLYNTDAIVFEEAGYPTLLFNEHLNYQHNLSRRHYHETTDDSSRVDFVYAESIARIAVETAAYLADAD